MDFNKFQFITKDLIFSAKYQYAQNGYTAKDGAIADVTSEPPKDNFYKDEHTLMFKLQYNF